MIKGTLSTTHYFTTGKADILNLAAPIGINSIVSSFVFTATGLSGKTPQSPYLSTVHQGISFPFAFIIIGTSF
jgi:hypothetical protein